MSLLVSGDLVADRYRVDGILGTGGMAEVHRAWDTHLGRFVAIKLFRPSADVTAGRRFDSEVRTLARLSHPGLVSVYDTGTSGQTPFVVLQLVDGQTLHDRIADTPLSPAEVRLLGARLADTLAYVHARGVVHRDVKPSNILLDTGGTAYLADFGLARLTSATRLTATGQLVGTAAYLAPEQVRGGEIDCPVDIYALGLVLLECLTGQREYQGTEVEAAVARLHRPPAVPQDLPPDLLRLLSLMTALTPHRRPTAPECARVLRGEELQPVAIATRVPPLRPRPSKGVLVGAASVLLGVVGITWATVLSPDPATSAPPESIPSSSTSATSTTTPPTSSAEPVVVVHTATVTVGTEQPPDDDEEEESGQRKDDRTKSPGHGKKNGS